MNEAQLEHLALQWLSDLGWTHVFGPDIAPDGPTPERSGYDQVILTGRLREALVRINPDLPPAALEDALRQITRPESPSLVENNRRFHRFLTDGVDVSYLRNGREVHEKAWLIDVDDLANNDWLAVSHFTVIINKKNRRPDILLFVNGLPLVDIELKNPEDENATLHHAYNQIQTYKAHIPDLYHTNELLVVADGLAARVGALTSGWDRFMPWHVPSPPVASTPTPGGSWPASPDWMRTTLSPPCGRNGPVTAPTATTSAAARSAWSGTRKAAARACS